MNDNPFLEPHTPKTGTALDFVRFDLRCPKCGMENKPLLNAAIGRESVECACNKIKIDVSSKALQDELARRAWFLERTEVI